MNNDFYNSFYQEDLEKLLFDSIETMTSIEVDNAIKKNVNAVFLRRLLTLGGVIAGSILLAGIIEVMSSKNKVILDVVLASCFWLICFLVIFLIQRYLYQERLKEKVKTQAKKEHK